MVTKLGIEKVYFSNKNLLILICNRYSSMFGFGHFLCLVFLLFVLKSDFFEHVSGNNGTVLKFVILLKSTFHRNT